MLLLALGITHLYVFNNMRHQYILKANQLGKQLAEKDLTVLADTKLGMGKECDLVATRLMVFWIALRGALPAGQGR